MSPQAAAAHLGISRGAYAGLLRRNKQIPVERLTGQRVRRVRRNVLDQLLVKEQGEWKPPIARPALVDKIDRPWRAHHTPDYLARERNSSGSKK